MGVWSTEILGNDLSSDIFESFTEAFRKSGAKVALNQVDKELENIDDEERAFFLSSLVYAEWLCNVVEEKHLQELIDLRKRDDFGLFWSTQKERKQWSNAIDKIIEDCLTGRKPKYPIKHSTKKDNAIYLNWNQWDVYAYKLSSSLAKNKGLYGKYMVLQKIGEDNSGDNNCDVIRIVNHIFQNLDDCANFGAYTLLPEVTAIVLEDYLSHDTDFFRWELSRSLHYSMFMFKPNEYPAKQLVFLANSPELFGFDKQNDKLLFHNCFWKQFERHTLIDLFEEWEGREADLRRFLEML